MSGGSNGVSQLHLRQIRRRLSSSSTAAVSSQDESVVILTKSSDDITSVKVSNEHGEYSVNKSESGKSTWSIPELGTLNANATAEAP